MRPKEMGQSFARLCFRSPVVAVAELNRSTSGDSTRFSTLARRDRDESEKCPSARSSPPLPTLRQIFADNLGFNIPGVNVRDPLVARCWLVSCIEIAILDPFALEIALVANYRCVYSVMRESIPFSLYHYCALSRKCVDAPRWNCKFPRNNDGINLSSRKLTFHIFRILM